MRWKHGFKVIDGDRPAPLVTRRDVLFGMKIFVSALAICVLIPFWPALQSVFPVSIARTIAEATAPHPDVRIIDGDTIEATAPRPNIRIIDGDTLEDRTSGVRYRLENIDTPEMGTRAQCAAERQHAERATNAARAMITRARNIKILTMGRTDRYGRTLARIEADGRDLGVTLVDRKLARPWRGRREPWCGPGGNLIL